MMVAASAAVTATLGSAVAWADAVSPVEEGLQPQNIGDTEPEPEAGPVYDMRDCCTMKLSATKFAYTGKAIKPGVTVTFTDPETGETSTLREGREYDYTVTYLNNVNAGTATVVVEGSGSEQLGGFVASLRKTFTIKAPDYKVATGNTAYIIKNGRSNTFTSDDGAGCGISAGKLTDRQAIIQNAYMSGIKITNRCKNISGTIKYRVNQRNRGWSSWKTGSVAGSTGKGYAAQAIEIKLTGDLAKKYDVYYRVNVFGCDWMGWAKNGQTSGVLSSGPLCVRKFQVKLKPKGSAAPAGSGLPRWSTSSTKDAYYKAVLKSKIKSKSSGTQYALSVNTEFNRMAVFKGSNGNWSLVKYWKCTTGASNERYATSHATFTTTGKRGLSFGEKDGHSCWYWTQIYSSVRFHSVLFVPYSKTSLIDGTLGERRSNGCIRLPIEAAKWIYLNVTKGTTVVIS